jgi:hypothetical protein
MTPATIARALDDEDRLAAILKEQIDHVVRDMATHVGDQIFELLKRHGLMMQSEAASTGMMVLASIQLFAQAADQCSRAAEDNCDAAVTKLFLECLPDNLAQAVRAELEERETSHDA